jgi:Secretion system C-terminal sorting domain
MKLKKKLFLIASLLFFIQNFSYSQNKVINYNLSHPIKFGQENRFSNPKTFSEGTDSFKVVAILVQFQEDNDELTTGNGLFDLDSTRFLNPATGKDTIIDAPPYDSSYFADHLVFLKNYFSKSSKGKLGISYDLFGRVINLPHNMQYYSPQRNESNAKLGNLFQDSWAAADSFINFSNYNISNTAFVIFHAGVGRDIDLVSQYGYDPRPYDIPSVYLGLKNLQEFYGNNYNGYQTQEGFFIQNSSIVPSTENRDLPSFGFFELGMNGIECANFGSYLGLPDLFNTVTGKTTIGRFGLMDGQSIFSYKGIFPPEPSAWEKIYLGWVNPIVISSGSGTVKLPTSSKDFYRDSTIYKVLINSKEYFLIENKNRDPENDGQTIYLHNRNFLDSNRFLVDSLPSQVPFTYYGFYTDNITLVDGNILDVQTLDWSLPGYINYQNNYKGGILVWHIDENVIDAKISSNTVNNDIDHKGVDLEEAKGAQQIGVTFNTISGGNITGDGTYVDYWFNGYHLVPSNIYKNAFTPTSTPNSLSYSLANNNIYVTNFSTIDTLMTFNVSIGGAISPINNFPKFVGTDTSGNSQAIAFDFTGSSGDEIFVNSNNNIYGFKSDGNGINTSGLLLSNQGKYLPSYISNGSTKYLIGTADFGLDFLDNNLNSNLLNWTNAKMSCTPLISESMQSVYVGKTNGTISKYKLDLSGIRIDSVSGIIEQFAKTPPDSFTFITNANKYLVVGNISSPTSTDILTVNNNNEFFINGNKLNLNYDISEINSSPVLADINSDGKQEIIFSNGDIVYALNSNGVLIDNFPADFNEDITSGISVADINNDNIYDLVFVTANGDLYAFGVDGNVVSGFPIKVGPNTTSTPALANLDDTLGIVVVSGDGYLYGFKTDIVYNDNKVLWKNYLKDKYLSNNNFESGNSPSAISGKLPADKVYNWPNPVYNNETFIRYYINGNASSVTIKILDLSGELVTTLNATAFSNSDNEVKWDASTVQSGIYYGVVEANIDGSTETGIIKIAIVK